ncbi:MAG: c-type cytochrome [Verrucomicrobia bacterium]|nr:c-type cytochrome [Verrucomicrobiota bacterium]
MSKLKPTLFATVLAAFTFALLAARAQAPAKSKPEAGLLLTFTSGGKSDTTTAPNVWLHVPAGQSPTPFLEPGTFSAAWSGNLVVDLRGDFFFRVELSGGGFKLELNGTNLLDVAHPGPGVASFATTRPIRLSKGANVLGASFSSTAGDATVRLQWSEKGILWEPIPRQLLTRSPADAALARAEKLRLGREGVFESRCVKCHAVPAADNGAPELAMDAPSFEGIGSRRHFAWMASWILDPKSQRATAHMPKLLHGATAKDDADAIAAFLASLPSPAAEQAAPSDADAVEAGKQLADKLKCCVCHVVPGNEPEPGKLPFKQVNAKFPPSRLAEFIRNPAEHFAWTRMPRFNMTAEEAQHLAAFIRSDAPMFKQRGAPTDAATLARGRHLLQTTGCLNCHALKLENQFKARPLAQLAVAGEPLGCLSPKPPEGARHPRYAQDEAVREAVVAFLAGDRAPLSRLAPVEFAERQSRQLQCTACHGQLEGFPPLERVGGKLKPEWMTKLFAGTLTYKPRHWLDHRMPSFASRAAPLAVGLAMSHGYAATTPVEGPINNELVPVGQKLLGTDGGFSCTSCHSTGPQKATQVFEAEGLNFAYPAERLQRDYFDRWILNPLRIVPTTKMPVYFDDDGRSPLMDVLGGDARKQLDALWHFMRLGDKVTPPPVQ